MERKIGTDQATAQISNETSPKTRKVLKLSSQKARELFEKSWSNYIEDCRKIEELHSRQMQNPEIARAVKAGARLG